jgi:hypothetical protein
MYAHVCMLVHTYRQTRRRGVTHTTARHAAQSPARVTGRKAATKKTKARRCSLSMCEHLSFQSIYPFNPTSLISKKDFARFGHKLEKTKINREIAQRSPRTPGMLRAAVLAVRDSFPIIFSHSLSVHELISHVKLYPYIE